MPKQKEKIPMLIMILILLMGIAVINGIFGLIHFQTASSFLGKRVFGTGLNIATDIIIVLLMGAMIYASIKAKKRGLWLAVGVGAVCILWGVVDIVANFHSMGELVTMIGLPESYRDLYPEEIKSIVMRIVQGGRMAFSLMLIGFPLLKKKYFKELGRK